MPDSGRGWRGRGGSEDAELRLSPSCPRRRASARLDGGKWGDAAGFARHLLSSHPAKFPELWEEGREGGHGRTCCPHPDPAGTRCGLGAAV